MKALWTCVVLLFIGLLALAWVVWRQDARMYHLGVEVASLTAKVERLEKHPGVNFAAPSADMTGTPATQKTAEPEVRFTEGDTTMSFKWSEATIDPAIGFDIGAVNHMSFSPSKKFLYLATTQPGGSASFIYDPATKTVHYIKNATDVGSWRANGKWEVKNYEQYGVTSGKVKSAYLSWSVDEPWNVSRVD